MDPAWTSLKPHRSLGRGDPRYTLRQEGGGADIAKRVIAGWRRIAVVGPMGVGKSTELAAAQRLLGADTHAYHLALDAVCDMRSVQPHEVFRLLHDTISPPPAGLASSLDLSRSTAAFRRDLLVKVLRKHPGAVLLLDGLEKAEATSAGLVAEELFSLGEDATVVLVLPSTLAYGPRANSFDDVQFVFVRPIALHGDPVVAANGLLFLKEIAFRHLEARSAGPNINRLVDAACEASGGIPRVVLQLLRDAHRHATITARPDPQPEDLDWAIREHGAFLRRSLLPGDRKLLQEAEGTDGGEIPLADKIRLYTQGILLEYPRGESEVVVHVAPTLAKALGFERAAA